MKILLPVKVHDFSEKQSHFEAFLDHNGYLNIYREIEAAAPGKVYILGGVIRDFFILGKNSKINDLDLVIDDVTDPFTEEKLVASLSSIGKLTKNRYNSYKLVISGGKQVDITPFTKSKYSADHQEFPSLATRLKTSFFNLESVALDMQTKKLYEIGFFKDLNNKTLSVLNEQYGQYHTHYVRAVLYEKKFKLEGFKIDKSVLDFLRKRYLIHSDDLALQPTEKLIKEYLESKGKRDQTEYLFARLKELGVI